MRDYFYNSMLEIMLNREFVPNTPCLVNAGKPKGQLAACFVLKFPIRLKELWNTRRRRRLSIKPAAEPE
jgi:ribonucleoside-diphosphate reductase alpha chain